MQPPASKPPTDVRSRILLAGVALLAEQGMSGLTQPKVAKAAGVRQSHLTYYFPTRADLLLGVVAQSMAGLMSGLTRAAHEGALTLGTLPAALAAGVTDQRRARVILGLIAASDENPQIREQLRAFIGTVRTQLAALLRELGAEADADTLAACHALLVGSAILNVARDDAASHAEAQMLARFLVERIVQHPRADPKPVAARPRSRGRRTGSRGGS